MRMRIVLRGARAHTARPWMGRNAIHRVGGLLGDLDRYQERRPVIDGCEYREALQAVRIEGGVAGNVVPDEVVLLVNHRFAPDRSPGRGRGPPAGAVRTVARGRRRGRGRRTWPMAPRRRSTIRCSPRCVARNDLTVRAKLGWTDVARFAAHGIPAANFGPGDATLAHTADERVAREPIERTYLALADLLRTGAPAP